MNCNNTVICFIDLFSFDQTVEYPDGQKERIPTSQLVDFLPNICFADNYNKIHLYGDTSFCKGIAEQIRNHEVTLYELNNNLEIEVN